MMTIENDAALKDGFYWVKRWNENDYWEIAERSDGKWWACGLDAPLDSPCKIGARVEEPPQ